MAYTHTFEIIINDDIDIQGELSFDNNEPPRVKTQSSMDIPLEELKKVVHFFEQLVHLYQATGEIKKIELVKKT